MELTHTSQTVVITTRQASCTKKIGNGSTACLAV